MKAKSHNQKGIVSFMVTIIMMLVISLIVIGFTQVANRARRDALDRQLSAQAFYAAESGVNSAVKTMETAMISGDIKKQDSCVGADYTPPTLNGTDVMVTCMLVNPVTNKITSSAAQNISTIVNVIGTHDDGQGHENPDELTFSWSPATPSPVIAGCNTAFGSAAFPTTGGGCQWGVLRIDLFRYNNGAFPNMNADDFAGKTMTVYAKPTTSGSSTVNVDFLSNTVVASASYSAGKFSTTLNITNGAGNQNYYVRMSMLYRDSPTVEITGKNPSGGILYFKNAQATIDVTAKAQDVLRRVRVKYPLGIGKDVAAIPYAVASGETICKKLTYINNTNIENSCP